MSTGSIIVCLAIGLLLILTGLWVWKKHRTQMAVQSEKGNVQDNKKSLGKTISILMLFIGVLTMIAPLLTFLIGTDYWVLYVFILILGSLFVMIIVK